MQNLSLKPPSGRSEASLPCFCGVPLGVAVVVPLTGVEGASRLELVTRGGGGGGGFDLAAVGGVAVRAGRARASRGSARRGSAMWKEVWCQVSYSNCFVSGRFQELSGGSASSIYQLGH